MKSLSRVYNPVRRSRCVSNFIREIKTLFFIGFLGGSCALVRAHDPFEVATTVSLNTNNMQLRMTLAAKTAELLVAEDGQSPPSLRSVADLKGVQPVLSARLAQLIQILAAGQRLTAFRTNVILGVEDHVQCTLTFPRPEAGALKFDATNLNKLPASDPYGAMLVIVDLPNRRVMGQQLLTAREPVFETVTTALPAATAAAGLLPKPNSNP